jgi:hypothetical protein
MGVRFSWEQSWQKGVLRALTCLLLCQCLLLLPVSSFLQAGRQRLEARCVDATVALKNDGKGLLNVSSLIRLAFDFDEHVFPVPASAGGPRAANEGAPLGERVGFARK